MKYIVYLTTNLVNGKIYVGIHKTENPDVFDGYLGNHVYVNDRHSYMFGKYPFHAAIRKYGVKNFRRKVLKVFDTLEEAKALEAEIVNEEFIKRKDTYNVALGGGVPPEQCKIIYQYDLEGNFIKEWPSITEASIYYKCSSSAIGKGVLDRTPSLGFLWTEYKLDKIDVNNFTIDANKITCYLYNSSGVYLQEFKSITDCANEIHESLANVSRAIKTNALVLKLYYISVVKYNKFPIPQHDNNIPVYQYDIEGNFIRGWKNVSVARKELKLSAHIPSCIKANTLAGGFQWSFEKLDKMPCKKPRARKIGKYSTDGELLETFTSVRKAKECCSSVPAVLAGKLKTAGGYIWKYIND